MLIIPKGDQIYLKKFMIQLFYHSFITSIYESRVYVRTYAQLLNDMEGVMLQVTHHGAFYKQRMILTTDQVT